MTAFGWVEMIAGLVLVLATLFDLFQSVVLPRPSVNRFVLVRILFRLLWIGWRAIGARVSSPARRETWLAAFGPVSILVIFAVWASAFTLGYALILDGLRNQIKPVLDGFGDAIYYSSTTIVPLSYGDYVPIGGAARVAIIAESATGVAIAALVITLLFSLYAAFQEREELVVTLDAMAGAPPSGVQLLETAAERGMRAELLTTFDDWRRWSAAVLESHLAYPALLYFRSSHDNEAWLNSFGAVMDAATLVLSTVDDDVEGPARLMFTVGNHLVEDLAWYFKFPSSADPIIHREEFERAVERLRKSGYTCRSKEVAWRDFSRLRAKYAAPLEQMSHRLAISPAEWIGNRAYVPHQDSPGRARRRNK